MGIAVGLDVAAPPSAVWEQLEQIERHVEWMADAVAIRFRTEQTRGVGTTFDCLTKVGPLRITDRMTITEWVPGETMGVAHTGAVTGSGRFVLTPRAGGRTHLAWEEELRFPWWLGGRLGALVAGRLVLHRLWRGNLRRFAALVPRTRADTY